MKKPGFTLLEVVLALAIVSIAFLALGQSFSMIAQAKITSLNHAKALFLLQERLSQARLQGLDKLPEEGVFSEPFEKFSWGIDKKRAAPSGLSKASVGVSWKKGRGKKELTAGTYILPVVNE